MWLIANCCGNNKAILDDIVRKGLFCYEDKNEKST